jgi:hypothetical protein
VKDGRRSARWASTASTPGIARGYDGAADAIIEVLEAIPTKRLTYQEAMKWAESVGGTLPTRKEAALLFANVPELFDANYAYWTCEPYAGDESYAWYQYFGYGTRTTPQGQ